MKPLLPAFCLSLGLSAAAVVPAVAYPVDCAILLCLAGGWPASAECTLARMVFIRRITPWPIEPPLQIWNCPMRAGYRDEPRPIERFFDVALRGEPVPPASIPEAPSGLQRVQHRADVDITGPAFDFVRSIRVFQTEYRQHRGKEGDCIRWSAVRLGRYGTQGDYHWSRSSTDRLPAASRFDPGVNCPTYRYRSVLVDWRDHAGAYGFEEVRY